MGLTSGYVRNYDSAPLFLLVYRFKLEDILVISRVKRVTRGGLQTDGGESTRLMGRVSSSSRTY